MTLTVRHNAPTLNATGTCPSCGAPIDPEATFCTECGMDFVSGKQIRVASGGWKRLVPGLLVLVVLAAGLLVFFRLGRHPQTAPEETKPIAPAVTEEQAAAVPPQIEDSRAAFEAKKKAAEETVRQRLDASEPLYVLSDTVEVRRKNGLVHKGTLQGFSGTGEKRVAVIATSVGEVGIPLIALDNPSRRRIDAEYREGFIQHLLNTTPSDASSEESEK